MGKTKTQRAKPGYRGQNQDTEGKTKIPRAKPRYRGQTNEKGDSKINDYQLNTELLVLLIIRITRNGINRLNRRLLAVRISCAPAEVDSMGLR